MVLVVVGGLVAKRTLWTWRWPLRDLGRDTIAWHPPIVGALLALVPGLLEGALVQRVAWGLVLGMAAPYLYDRFLHPEKGGSPVRWSTVPPPAPRPNNEGSG